MSWFVDGDSLRFRQRLEGAVEVHLPITEPDPDPISDPGPKTEPDPSRAFTQPHPDPARGVPDRARLPLRQLELVIWTWTALDVLHVGRGYR